MEYKTQKYDLFKVRIKPEERHRCQLRIYSQCGLLYELVKENKHRQLKTRNNKIFLTHFNSLRECITPLKNYR